jgi:cytochrome c oxidase subunit II
VRRKLPSFVLAALLALATAGAAAAANGGFTPVQPESPNASHTQTAYYVILGFTAAIFVIVEGLLVAFVVKYRQRGRSREVEGAQIHGHTRLEVIWTVIPVVILGVIALVVFLELPNIDKAPASTDPIHITVEGHQYYWQFDYVDSPNHARSIGTMHVPVGQVVDLKVVSPDVIHSWWVPALGGKIQAIPGRINHFWFKANKAGRYEGQCAELCGVFHASMRAVVQAESQQSYRHFVSTYGPETLGNLGQGGYGPSIASNTLLKQISGLQVILRNGFTGSLGAMPPVGQTWTHGQISSLVTYMRKHIYRASAGATSGG